MTPASIIPSHSIASWLLTHIDNFLDLLGLSKYHTVEQIIYFIIILIVSVFVGWLIKIIVLAIANKIVKVHNSSGAQELLKMHTLTKCAHFIPPLIFLSFVPFAFEHSDPMLTIIVRVTLAYTCITLAIGICAVLRYIFVRYDEKENTKNLPIAGVLNIATGIVWIVVIIIAISIIVHKSPAALLGGLTAFAAALMLVFKDSILGFVAGIQMSQNDMLRVGDWIVVPSTMANGVVLSVSLTTVKVQNWDNTIVTVPPYTLVSTSFQNWRGMCDSGVRRMSQSIYINPDTIKAPDSNLITALSNKYPAVKQFVDGLQQSGKTVAWNAGNAPLNGTIETNLGLFRAYMVSYLLASDMIDHKSDLMVQINSISHEGVALQIYCFSVTTQWEQYEGVMSAVMEHAMLASSDFGLEILSADHLNITQGQPESK